jgi:hypothetical protein
VLVLVAAVEDVEGGGEAAHEHHQEEEVELDVAQHLLDRVQEGEAGGAEDAGEVLQPAGAGG